MYTRIATMGLATCTALGFSQNSGQLSRAPDGGNVIVLVEPTVHASSLLELIRKSKLIVDGTVGVVEPTINTSQDQNVTTLETHSVVAVNAVLAGAVPNSSANILLAQVGGHLGKWDMAVAEDPLVAPGERYILFLVPDERKELPNNSGMPRYAVVGVWTGKIKVTNGTVAFAGPSSAALHTYDGTDVNAFLQTLRETILRPYTKTNLPPNPPLPQ